MTTPLRVCVLEDPRVQNNHLGRRLKRAGVQVEVLAQQPRAFLTALAGRLPQVALIDVSHPGGDRLAVLETVARVYPSMRVIAAVPDAGGPLAMRCRAAGAWGCVRKQPGNGRVLARALRSARHLPARRPPNGLTPRERQVLAQLSAGSDNLKIAAQLGITERTVKFHVTHLYQKLGAQSRVELALAGRAMA